MVDEKEWRLSQHQERDRVRHTDQSIEKREATLERLRAARQERLTAETAEQRDARLEHEAHVQCR